MYCGNPGVTAVGGVTGQWSMVAYSRDRPDSELCNRICCIKIITLIFTIISGIKG